MHRKIVFAVVLVLHLTAAHAQMVIGLNKDSLKQKLSALPSDTNRVNLLITIGQQYEDSNPDSALYYYQHAGTLSEQLNYNVGIIKYINNYTAVLNVQGKLQESIQLNLKAAAISEQQGLKLYEGKAYNNIGAVYQYQEDYPMAIQYYLKALTLVENTNDKQSLSLLFTNLCGVYRNMNQPEKAFEYAKRALTLSEEQNDSYSQAKALINLGNCFKDLHQYEQAKDSYEKARSIALDIQDVNTLETTLINMGNMYMDLNKPDQYLPIFYEALPLADSIQDVSGKAYALLGISEGLYYGQQWEQAEVHLNEAIAFTKLNDQKELLSKLYLLFSDLMIATHRFDEARSVRLKHDSVELLIMNESVVENVQALEAKYRFGQQQNALLQKDLQLQKSESQSTSRKYWLALLSVGVLLLLSMLVFLFLYYRQRQIAHQQAMVALEGEKTAVRLQSLVEGEQQERVRISQEIHDDMGSGLTSMLFLSRSIVSTSPSDKHVMEKLIVLATSLIEKMNEIVWAMRSDPEPLEDFVTYLRSMAGEMLGNAGIEFQFELKRQTPSLILPTEYRHHVYLIIKEAIHNIIKHSKASSALLTLDFQSVWRIEISDNGVGFPEGISTGNGLKNMRRRATALRGHILVQHHDGTRLKVEVPAPL